MKNLYLFFLTLVASLCFSSAFCQQGTLKDLTVISFEAPYQKMIVDYSNMDIPIKVTSSTEITGTKGRITPEQVAPNTIIDVLEYKLVGSDRVALSIQTSISLGGEVSFTGLIEGKDGDMAIIDGRKVKLKPGLRLEGSRKKKCECKGMLYAGLSDPMLQPGQYFIEVKGEKKLGGYVEAEEVDICRNTFSAADRELRKAVEDGYRDNGLKEIMAPQGTFGSLHSKLYNGQIKIGQYSYKLVDDIKIQGYVNMVGERLIPEYQLNMRSDDPNKIFFRFFVIDNPVPNAFAFPNGMIFIHTGLIDIMENEAQLATVLGHEIAHVTHEHGRDRYELTSNSKFGKKLGKGLLNYGKEFVDLNFGEDDGVLGIVGDVANSVTPEGIANVIKPQPKREAQADRVGVYYAYRAGYDIRESVKLWEKMSDLTGQPSFQSQLKEFTQSFLASSARNLSRDPLKTLSAVGKDMLINKMLDTIYTSHPKARTRAYDIGQLLTSYYQGEDFSAYVQGQEEYEEYFGGF